MITTKDLFDKLEIKEWLELNKKLQMKKNSVRKTLKEKGVLKREGNNEFDRYKYFSEAQYKQLFTALFADAGLELKFDELSYELFEGSGKNANGREAKIRFYLYDTDTGFFESTDITAEGMDKGDKAGYKAYTGALKYFLADSWMVATGDDPEKDSPEEKMNVKAESREIEELKAYCTPEQIDLLLKAQGVSKIEDLPKDYVKKAIAKAKRTNTVEKKKNGTQFDMIQNNEETF